MLSVAVKKLSLSRKQYDDIEDMNLYEKTHYSFKSETCQQTHKYSR